MDSKSQKIRMLIGSAMLGAVLLFAVYGVVLNLKAGNDNPYVPDSIYVEECESCHLAYPPGLLPVKSWQGIMQGLEDHFGDNAELDDETYLHISDYLERFALRKGQQSGISQLLRKLPEDPPLRISELPGFISAHEEVLKQSETESMKEGFLSYCEDCHSTAANGVFDEELLHPDYDLRIRDRFKN